MLYAQVIVKKKTRVEELTYLIPAAIIPVITVGSLVSVPLRRSVVPAAVIRFVRTVPRQIKPRLREIISIKKDGHFSAAQILVIKLLADYYGATLAEVAFHALQEPNVWPSGPSVARPKPYFVQGVWPDRHGFYQKLLLERRANRFLVIFAQTAMAALFYQQLVQELQAMVVLDDGSAASRQKKAALTTSNSLVATIGTLGSIFCSLSAGDTIIIDQPAHIGLMSAQRPYLKARQIGRVRAEAENLLLVFGDTLVKIEDLPFLQRREWQLKVLPLEKKPVFITDRRGTRDLILPAIIDQIADSLQAGQRVLVLVLARGWASALVCRDCGHVFICPHCQRTAAVRETSLGCPFCATAGPRPIVCPECQGVNLLPVGEGVAQVARELDQLFPNNRINSLSSDQPELDEGAEVVVATEKVLSFPEAKFDAVVIISADRLISGTNLNGSWQFLAELLELQQSSGSITAQTFLPDHPVWSVLGSHDLRHFYARELTNRRQLKLPPFSTIFRLVGTARTIRQLEEQAELITTDVLKLLPAAELSYLEIKSRSGRNFHGYLQILTPAHLSVTFKRDLSRALPPAWHLAVD